MALGLMDGVSQRVHILWYQEVYINLYIAVDIYLIWEQLLFIPW